MSWQRFTCNNDSSSCSSSSSNQGSYQRFSSSSGNDSSSSSKTGSWQGSEHPTGPPVDRLRALPFLILPSAAEAAFQGYQKQNPLLSPAKQWETMKVRCWNQSRLIMSVIDTPSDMQHKQQLAYRFSCLALSICRCLKVLGAKTIEALAHDVLQTCEGNGGFQIGNAEEQRAPTAVPSLC